MYISPEALKLIYQEDLFILVEKETVETHGKAEDLNQSTEMPYGVDELHEPAPINYLGSNKKGILILVQDIESEFLNAQDLDFLMKIIESGLKYAGEDIAIVNCIRFPYWQIFDELHHSFLIGFGDHQEVHFNDLIKYEVAVKEGVRILLADDLKTIAGDRNIKMKLWKALQRMFDIN
jgi:hypothetical protein